MDSTFWAGIVIGSFSGVLLSLFTRPLERLLDRRGEDHARSRAAELKEASVGDRQRVRDWLVVQLLEIALIGALAGVGSGLCFGLQSFLAYSTGYEDTRVLNLVLVVIGQLTAIAGAALVLRLAGNAVATARLLQQGKTLSSPSKASSNR